MIKTQSQNQKIRQIEIKSNVNNYCEKLSYEFLNDVIYKVWSKVRCDVLEKVHHKVWRKLGMIQTQSQNEEIRQFIYKVWYEVWWKVSRKVWLKVWHEVRRKLFR